VGPILLAPGDGTLYDYVINSATDSLELYVQSNPGVGTLGVDSAYTREVSIALSGTDVVDYDSVSTHAGCKLSFERFTLDSPTTGVTISDTSTDLTNSATGTETQCFFNHKYSVAWSDFRNTTLANCGFTITNNASVVNNATYQIYSGRVHVLWKDYVNLTSTEPLRPNATIWCVLG
jgi:hypothetical protein